MSTKPTELSVTVDDRESNHPKGRIHFSVFCDRKLSDESLALLQKLLDWNPGGYEMGAVAKTENESGHSFEYTWSCANNCD